jgi:hypothetical protein
MGSLPGFGIGITVASCHVGGKRWKQCMKITDGFISSTQDHSSDVHDHYETVDCESVDSGQIYFVHEAGCEVVTVGSGGQSDVCYIDALTRTDMNQHIENTTIGNVNEIKAEMPQMNLVQLNDLSVLVSDDGLSSSEQGFVQLISGEISTVNKTDQNRGRSRKRPRQEATWTRIVNKICRNMGMAYVNKTGKLQRARTPSNFTYCCRKKCSEIVSEEDRKAVFDQFWSLGSWELQTSFILSLAQNVMVKRRKRNGKNSRKYNYLFMLNRHRVCRKFSVSHWMLNTNLCMSTFSCSLYIVIVLFPVVCLQNIRLACFCQSCVRGKLA